MKKRLVIALLFLSMGIHAQERVSHGWGLGFQLNEWGNDFGIGFSAFSPEVFGALAFDVSYVNQFRSSITITDEAWQPYGIASIGVRAKAGQLTPWFHMYGFGRVSVLTNGGSGWETGKVTGSGGFGFEFNTNSGGLSPVSYYIELGGYGGFSDVHPLHQSVAGGFGTTVGLRVYL